MLALRRHVAVIVIVALCVSILPVSLILDGQLIPSGEELRAKCAKSVYPENYESRNHRGDAPIRMVALKVAQTDPASGQGNQSRSHPEYDCLVAEYTKALARITVALVGATGVLGIATFFAAIAALRAAEHLPIVERAYVFVGVRHGEIRVVGERIKFKFYMANHGRSPGLVQEFWYREAADILDAPK
jgi:hypothetical protein